MQIGRTLYYDNQTSIILKDCGEREGAVYQTDILEDLQSFPSLSEINLLDLRVLSLEYGADLQQALTANSLSFPAPILPTAEELEAIKQARIAELQAELALLQA